MGNVVTNPDLKAVINRNSLFTVESVTYLGDTFVRNANRTNYFEGIFRKHVRLSIFAKKLGRLSTPAECIRKYSEACATPINLYCSPAIFSGLFCKNLLFLNAQLSSTVMYAFWVAVHLTRFVCERHIESSSVCSTGCWLTETLSCTTACRSFLDIYLDAEE